MFIPFIIIIERIMPGVFFLMNHIVSNVHVGIVCVDMYTAEPVDDPQNPKLLQILFQCFLKSSRESFLKSSG